jgi:hypothetical protein
MQDIILMKPPLPESEVRSLGVGLGPALARGSARHSVKKTKITKPTSSFGVELSRQGISKPASSFSLEENRAMEWERRM